MRRLIALGVAVALLAGPRGASAESGEPPSLAERWRALTADLVDPADGQFDVSAFLERAAGFLPVPLVVTEPAVGYGGGLFAMFVRPRRAAGQEGYARPDISGIGALRTQNGTHLAFAGDMTRWMDGRLRTLAGGGGGAIRLDVYGLGQARGDRDEPVRYTLDVKAAGGQVDWQLAPGSPCRSAHARSTRKWSRNCATIRPFRGSKTARRRPSRGPGSPSWSTRATPCSRPRRACTRRRASSCPTPRSARTATSVA